MINFLKKKKELLMIFCISFFLFFVKWTLSLYFFNDEDLSIRVINESSSTNSTYDSYQYFHYIKSLADLNFGAIYDPEISSNYYLLIPYGSIIFHSIVYKLIGNSSFVLLEFLAIFLFITIFYLIFRLINFSKNLSILLPVIFYTLPDFLHFFNYFNIIEIGSFSGNFYNLRFPRPLVSNLFFFAFIYILIQSHIEKNLFTKKNLFSLSIIFGMTLSSFFFLFLTIAITFILYLLIYFKKNIFQIINLNLKKIIYSLILFILIILPFIFLLYFTNPDYSERMGIIEITLTDKFFLLNHYFYKLFRLKLVLVYIALFFSYLFMKKFNYENLKYVYIFYILFVSSIIAPFVFIIFSNKIAFLYHLNNTVVVCLVLLILMFFLVNVNLIMKKIKINFKNEYLTISVISIIIIIHNFNIFHNYKKDIDNQLRIERSKIINILLKDDSIDISKSKILTLDRKIMTWSLFKDNRDLYIIDGTFTIRDNSSIENDLINLFKFLKLSDDDFLEAISNKKIGYRYNNPVIRNFFWQKYTANSFYTFDRSKDFDRKTLDFLIQSSPFYSHQFAIPNFEITRLVNKFRGNNIQIKKNPDIVIIEKNNKLFSKKDFDNDYCKIFHGKELDLYIVKKLCN